MKLDEKLLAMLLLKQRAEEFLNSVHMLFFPTSTYCLATVKRHHNTRQTPRRLTGKPTFLCSQSLRSQKKEATESRAEAQLLKTDKYSSNLYFANNHLYDQGQNSSSLCLYPLLWSGLQTSTWESHTASTTRLPTSIRPLFPGLAFKNLG